MKALAAIEHTLLTAIWHMIRADVGYTDLGGHYYTRRNPDTTKQRALTQLRHLATTSRSRRSPPPAEPTTSGHLHVSSRSGVGRRGAVPGNGIRRRCW
jgi:hypothetical protein